MSGMSDVVKLAQSAIQASSAGATAAGAQASSNEQNAVGAAADIFKANLSAKNGKDNSVASKNTSQQGAVINEQDKRKDAATGGGTAAASGAASGASAGAGGGKAGAAGGGNTGGVAASSAPASTSSGNPALDVATFGSEGKPTDEAIRNALGLDPNSPVPTPAVTNEGVPLQDWMAWGSYGRFFIANDDAPKVTITIDFERELIASNLWRPDFQDFDNFLGTTNRGSNGFDYLLYSLSLQPAGSVQNLSFCGYIELVDTLHWEGDLIFNKTTKEWSSDFPVNEPAFASLREKDLATVPDIITRPYNRGTIRLADVRKAFAANAQIFIYPFFQSSSTRDFIQIAANFFQVKATGFPQRQIHVYAQEIGVSTSNELLKSYSFALPTFADPDPANKVGRVEQLLSDPSAFTAFPRRA